MRPATRWIVSNTIPLANKVQELWVTTVAIPAHCNPPAINPKHKNIAA